MSRAPPYFGLRGAGCYREVLRNGIAEQPQVAVRVERHAQKQVVADAAEIGAVYRRGSLRIDDDQKSVAIVEEFVLAAAAVEGPLNGIGCALEAGRIGGSGDVDQARRIYGQGQGLIVAGTSQEGGVKNGCTRGVQFGHEAIAQELLDGERQGEVAGVGALHRLRRDRKILRAGGARSVSGAGAVHHHTIDDVVALPTQVRGINQRLSGATDLRYEPVTEVKKLVLRLASLEAGLRRSRCSGEVGGQRPASDIYVSTRIDGDGKRGIIERAAEECRKNQLRAGRIQLGHERIAGAEPRSIVAVRPPDLSATSAKTGLERSGSDGKITRESHSGDVSIPVRIDGDGPGGVVSGATEESGIDKLRAGWIEFRDERVAEAVARIPCRAAEVRLQGARRRGEVRGVGISGDVSVAGGIHRDARGHVIAGSSKICHVDDRARRVELGDKRVAGDESGRLAAIGFLERAGRHREIVRIGEACDVHVSGAVGSDGKTHLVSGGSEIGGVAQYRVDHQRARAIVRTDTEADAATTLENETSVHGSAIAVQVLIQDRLFPAHLAGGGFQHQIAITIDARAAGSLNVESNRTRVGAGLQHKIVFQFAVAAVKDQVDTVVHAGCAQLGEGGDIGAPVSRPVAQQVIGASRQGFQRLDAGLPARAYKLCLNGRAAVSPRIRPGQLVAGLPHHESVVRPLRQVANIGRRLSTVLFKTQRLVRECGTFHGSVRGTQTRTYKSEQDELLSADHFSSHSNYLYSTTRALTKAVTALRLSSPRIDRAAAALLVSVASMS